MCEEDGTTRNADHAFQNVSHEKIDKEQVAHPGAKLFAQ